ncbi:MAG: glycosyltransferase [Bacteroidota bacterium]
MDQNRHSTLLISLIVCTYNRDKFLGDCLDSIARQNLEPHLYEVLVINNNSNDGTQNIIDSHKLKRRPNWKFYLETNQGLSFARNRGIAEAQGEYLTYVDDDAILPEDFLSTQYKLLNDHKKWDGLGGKIIAKFEDEKPEWFNKYTAPTFFSHYDKGDKAYQYRLGDFPFGCNMCLRRSLAESVGGFDINLGRIGKGGLGGEEKKIYSQVISKGANIWYVPQLWVYHQTDAYRTQEPYLKKISIGLGVSHKLLYCNNSSSSWACYRATLIMYAKFLAACLLAIGYRIQGRARVGQHLIQFRRWVLEGFHQS